MSEHYDVVIVGGRVAGASLAMRLAQQNLKILLIDRATFPSWPAVPSSPLIHPGTMRLLDELGLAEEAYTHPEAKVTHLIMDMMGKFQAIMPMALMELDRSYAFGIDRNKFDTVMWQRAAALPNVTACQNFAMMDAVKDTTGRVTGIIGRPTDSKSKETITADLVVGADGRFSMAARKFGSEPFEELNDYPTASYHAEWEGVAPYSKECAQPIMIYQLGGGYSILCFPVDKQKYIIGNYLRTADTHFNNQSLEEHYHQTIQSIPRLSGMLKNARRITPVVGVRRIDNGYRQAYGDGWALVGDAFHYESPLDGQGFYNALLASQFLAEAVEQWRNGRPWLEAGAEYQQRFYDSSHEMLKQTVNRVKQELFMTPPPFVTNHLMRWVMTDPGFQRKFLLYLSRSIDPNSFSFAPSPGPLLRGLMRDIFRVRPLRFEPVESNW